MKRVLLMMVFFAALHAAMTLPPASSQTAKPQPLTIAFKCPSGDCPLLTGVPQTAGMRSGYVRLKPAKTVGWHTTGKNEESLVILAGQGEARIEGEPARKFTAPALVYIPPDKKHNVVNTGHGYLEYVYVVAPAQTAR